MKNNKIFFADGESPSMINAFQQAQKTFKYFWRELSWEYRRIVPGLEIASVKVAFSQQFDGDELPTIEHMWVNDINFDGDHIFGRLINAPNQLTNVENGEEVAVPLAQISDWLFASGGKTFGGFTIHAIRKQMEAKERKAHDEAWGLDFGSFDDIEVAVGQKERPNHLIEHPMSSNMKESFAEFLQKNPLEITKQDEGGFSMLHREAIAGNATTVALLLELGANKNAKTEQGKMAIDFAHQLDWQPIIDLLK